LLSLNDRKDWRVSAGMVRDIRHAARGLAKAVHTGEPFTRARIRVIYHACDRRRRDSAAGNWALSGKAALDGIVDAGVLRDDDDTVISSTMYLRGNDVPHSAVLVIQVTEVR
jgi:hypothetical protein